MCRNDFRRKWILFKYLAKCYDLWSRNMRLGGERGIRKDYGELYKMDVYTPFLHTKIFNYEEASYG